MTPCTINGKPTLRFAKIEQKALANTAGLIHALSYYDNSLTGIAAELRCVVSGLDDDGVYKVPEKVSL